MDGYILDAFLDGYARDHSPAEVAVAERVLSQFNGTIPDEQLISEAALAVAIHRRERDRST